MQRILRAENAHFGPQMQAVSIDHADHQPGKAVPARAWRSRGFLAVLYIEASGAMRLTVNRTMVDANGDWIDGITWDELQRIKIECGLGDMWGVEAYPPPLELVHVSNMRHLFLFKEKPAWAWGRG